MSVEDRSPSLGNGSSAPREIRAQRSGDDAIALGGSRPGDGAAALTILRGPHRATGELRAEAAEQARARGGELYRGAFSSPARRPYDAFAEIFLALIRDASFQGSAEDRARAALSAWVPEIRAARTNAPPLPPLAPADAAIRFRALVAESIIGRAERAPLVLWIEHAEHADPESIALLETIVVHSVETAGRVGGEEREHAGSEDGRDGEGEGAHALAFPLEIIVCLEEPPLERPEHARVRRLERRLRRSLPHTRAFSLDGSPTRPPGHSSVTELEDRFDELGAVERLAVEILARSSTAPIEVEIVDIICRETASTHGESWDLDRTRALIESIEALGLLERVESHGVPAIRFTDSSIVVALANAICDDRAEAQHATFALAAAELASRARAEFFWSRIGHHARLSRRTDIARSAMRRFADHARAVHASTLAAETYEQLFELEATVAKSLEGTIDRSALARVEDERAAIARILVDLYRELEAHHAAHRKLVFLASQADRVRDAARLAATWREIGEVNRALGDLANARVFLERSAEYLRELRDPGSLLDRRQLTPKELEEYAKSLVAVAAFRLSQSEPSAARETLDEASDFLAAIEIDPRIRARAELLDAEILEAEGRAQAAADARQRGLATAESAEDLSTIFSALETVGRAHLRARRFTAARETFEKGVTLARASFARSIESRFLRLLADACLEGGDAELALESLRASERAHAHRWSPLEEGEARHLAGRIHVARGEIGLALPELERAVKDLSRARQAEPTAAAFRSLSRALRLAGRFDAAAETALGALDRQSSSPTTAADLAYATLEAGRVALERGDLRRAVSFARRAERAAEHGKAPEIRARAQLVLAEARLREGRLAEALHHVSLSGELDAVADHRAIMIERARIRAGALRIARQPGRALRVIDSAIDDLARASGDCEVDVAARLERARAFHAAGDSESALELLDALREPLRGGLVRLSLCRDLEECAIRIALGEHDAPANLLESVYASLERYGARDLVPWYFLLRGRLEAERDAEASARFYERALAEAVAGGLGEVEWRALEERATVESRRGEESLARELFDRARRTLERLAAGLSAEDRAAWLELESDRRPRFAPKDAPAEAIERKSLEASSGEDEDASESGMRSDGRELEAVESAERVLRAILSLQEASVAPIEGERDAGLWRAVGSCAAELFARDGSAVLVEEDGESLRFASRHRLSPPSPDTANEPSQEILALAREAISSGSLVAVDAQPERPAAILVLPFVLEAELGAVLVLVREGEASMFLPSEIDRAKLLGKHAFHAFLGRRRFAAERERIEALERARRDDEVRRLKLRQKIHKQSVQLAIADADLRHHQELLEARYSFDQIIGRSPAIRQTIAILERLCDSSIPVLLFGESGTGKELIARAIHFNGPRRNRRFVSESCAALTPELLEAEWFGHERGAFTGAVREREGLLLAADGGTVFLDGVDAMHFNVQAKFLRFLQSGELRPLGSKESRRTDVRVIAATAADLQQLVADGAFRDDLFYRLNGITVRLPPLRERREDIPLLVDWFCRAIAARDGRPAKRFSQAALRKLGRHDWPGNVRELRNLVEKVHLVSDHEVIEADAFDLEAAGLTLGAAPQIEASFREARDRFEREYIESLVRACDGNIAQAAARSGLSRESLYRLLRKHAIQPR